MSFLTKVMLEAEGDSAMDFMRAVMGKEGLRVAMQAALTRQADSRRGPVHQEPGPGSRRPDPRVGAGSSMSGPISNNSPGRPDVTMVGRSPRPAKPIQSVKSRIVPEPYQIQSAPPRRSSPLEPPGS